MGLPNSRGRLAIQGVSYLVLLTVSTAVVDDVEDGFFQPVVDAVSHGCIQSLSFINLLFFDFLLDLLDDDLLLHPSQDDGALDTVGASVSHLQLLPLLDELDFSQLSQSSVVIVVASVVVDEVGFHQSSSFEHSQDLLPFDLLDFELVLTLLSLHTPSLHSVELAELHFVLVSGSVVAVVYPLR